MPRRRPAPWASVTLRPFAPPGDHAAVELAQQIVHVDRDEVDDLARERIAGPD